MGTAVVEVAMWVWVVLWDVVVGGWGDGELLNILSPKLNRCIQEPGAGDGPASVVLDFLRDCGVPKIK